MFFLDILFHRMSDIAILRQPVQRKVLDTMLHTSEANDVL
jgi:hypothetical protein